MAPVVCLAAGCVVVEKFPGGDGDGGGGDSSVTGATVTDGGGATAGTSGGSGGATGTGEPTFPPGHDDECPADTAADYDFADWDDLPEFDNAALEQIPCPAQDPPLECVATPIPGLQSAVVIRNDRLAAPKPYLPPMARWFIVSNAPLGCGDPLGAPLCEGQWRIAWPMDPDSYCFSVLGGEWSSGFYYGEGAPVLIDFGDAACQTHAGTMVSAIDHKVELLFPPKPVGLPIVAQQCMRCEIPGVPPMQLAGQFSPEVCP